MSLYLCPNTECTAPRVKLKVDYRLCLIIMCRCRFIRFNQRLYHSDSSPVTTTGLWGTWCLTIGRWPAPGLGFHRQQSSSLAMIYWKSVLDTRVWKKEKSKKHFLKVLILKSKHRNFPGWSSGWDSTLLVQGAQFDLVRAIDPVCCN